MQKATGEFSVVFTPLMKNGRFPLAKHRPSENSHSAPLLNFLTGQATGPCMPWVVACWQTAVVGLHGPSPVLPLPSIPPTQVWNTCGSENEEPSVNFIEKESLFVTDEQDSPCPISCCMSTPPSSAAQGVWFCFLAVLYSAWKPNGFPEQSVMLVFWKPFFALATMNPVLCVVRSVTEAFSPAGVLLIDAVSMSPEFIFSVCLFPNHVPTLGRCGLGGPAGTPLVCMNAKLTGSMQLLLQVLKPKVHIRLSMVSAAHHWVLLQLVESTNPSPGERPGGYHCSSMKAEPAAFGSLIAPELLSLSGLHGFCGYDFGSQIPSPNHGAALSSAYVVTLPFGVGAFFGSVGNCSV